MTWLGNIPASGQKPPRCQLLIFLSVALALQDPILRGCAAWGEDIGPLRLGVTRTIHLPMRRLHGVSNSNGNQTCPALSKFAKSRDRLGSATLAGLRPGPSPYLPKKSYTCTGRQHLTARTAQE